MTQGNPHKPHLDEIKTLAMLKMEKNFIAHNEKGYPRKPYADKNQPISFLIARIKEEHEELTCSFEALKQINRLDSEDIALGAKPDLYYEQTLNEMREECADISNLTDYLFEKLTVTLISLHSKHTEGKK